MDYDKNGDGNMGFQEYMDLMKDFMEDDSVEEIRRIREEFNRFDSDGNHRLTVDELAQILEKEIFPKK